VFSFIQNIIPIDEIPIKTLLNEIEYNKKNPEFSQEIIEIDKNYLKNTSIKNIELVSA